MKLCFLRQKLSGLFSGLDKPKFWDKKSLLLALCSSLLLVLSFSFPVLGSLAWFGLVPFLISLENASLKQRLLISFLFAFFFFLGTVYWLAHVSLFGLLLACAYLGLEFSLFGVFYPGCKTSGSVFLSSLLWITLEKIRGILFTGFGWGLLGYTQSNNLALIQAADIFGVWGISFLIMLFNACLARFTLLPANKRLIKNIFLIPALLIAAFYLYGLFRLNSVFPSLNLSVSIVQPNIAQDQKWDSFYSENILKKLRSLSFLAAKDSPGLIIWPETSVPGYFLDEPKLYNAVIETARELKTYLLVGSPREDYAEKTYFNSVFILGPNGELNQFHDKIHLVPFGEYIPYKKILGFLDCTGIADFSAGKRYTLLKVLNKENSFIRFGVLICFEDVFPGIVKQFRKTGADFLITVSNEAWFKQSSEPAQHLSISIFRAIENRCWFIRCANTGISCFITPQGKVMKKIQQGNKDIFIQGQTTLTL